MTKTEPMNCWICGNYANTKEHKFKSSIIKEFHGKQFETPLIIIKNNEKSSLQGPNSKLLKHNSPICSECNNNITSEHDKAFDKLIKYSMTNQNEYTKDNYIDLRTVYSDNWEIEIRNFYKFFAKQIGCRISNSDNNQNIESLADFIVNDVNPKTMKLLFQIKEGFMAINWYLETNHNERLKYLSHGSTIVLVNSQGRKIFYGYSCFNWLTIHWIYSENNIDKEINQFRFNKIPLFIQKVEEIPIDNNKDKFELFENFGNETYSEITELIKFMKNANNL